MKNITKYLGIGLAALTLAACSNGSSSDAELTVGVLQYVEHEALTAAREGFQEELEKLGYAGKITWDVQNPQADQSQLQTMSEKLVEGSDLILAIATPAAQSVATVTSETPVLFTAVTDPVSADLVDSIDKPGGLLTGTSDQAPIDKQIELLWQALPSAQKIGILYTTSERNSEVQVEEAEKLLKAAGYEVEIKGITSTNDVQDAASSLMKTVDAIFVPTDNIIASTMSLIGELSLENGVPVIGGSTDMVDLGGLLTYGTDYKSLGAQTAKQAVKILEGTKPADIAVEYPETVALHVNEEVAEKLGVDVSNLSAD